MRLILTILFAIASVLALAGCNEAYIPPGTDPETGEPVLTSHITMRVSTPGGYWIFSNDPGVHHAANCNWDITGTVTATLYPAGGATIGEWMDAPGVVSGNSITMTGDGTALRVTVLLAPAGSG